MSKPDLKPDDICTCGSGRRYADCHMPIFTAPRGKAVNVAQEIYAREWGVNASHYVNEGLYAALAAELVEAGDIARVLDLGCGTGQGLEALSAALHGPARFFIAGIDENPHCIAVAASRLGLPEEAVASPRVQPTLGLKLYDAVPDTKPIAVRGNRVLVNADVLLADPAFERWLCHIGPFDAIRLSTMGDVSRTEVRMRSSIVRSIAAENFSSYLRRMSSGFSMSSFASSGRGGLHTRRSGFRTFVVSPSNVYRSKRNPNFAVPLAAFMREGC